MISVSNSNLKKILKLGTILLVVYVVGYMIVKMASLYQNSYEKNRLTHELSVKKQETRSLKQRIKITNNRMKRINSEYITKEELELKVKDIFKRFSVLDYELKYLDSKKMCIDRYILITQLSANSEKGLKAGEGILNYIGKVKQSEKNETIYFVDYISKKKPKSSE